MLEQLREAISDLIGDTATDPQGEISPEEFAARNPKMTEAELGFAMASVFEKMADLHRREAQGLPLGDDETPGDFIEQAFGDRPYALLFMTQQGDVCEIRGACHLAGNDGDVAIKLLGNGMGKAVHNQIRDDRAKAAAATAEPAA